MQIVHGASKWTRRSRLDRLIATAICALSIAMLADCGTAFEAAGPTNGLDASAHGASDTGVGDGEADATNIILPPLGLEAGTPSCDTTKEPKDAKCLVSEAYGVFVSPNGSAAGDGTRAAPLRSIDAAITLANSQDAGAPKAVYICAGTYDETISIDATRDGTRIFAGFSCSDWSYPGTRAVVAPTAAGVPLTLMGLTSALFADIEIDAQSGPQTPPATASAPGASSIAVVANGATGVEFRRAKLVAGNGQPGANGVLLPYAFPGPVALRGNAADGGAGGPANSYACPGSAVTTGGKGGDFPNGSGDKGLPALGGGSGSSSDDCVNDGASGSIGAPAGNAPNAGGALTFGAFAGATWQPAGGLRGSPGGPGQGGGGGGGGNASFPGGGGGGGAGGCGGAGGGGGGGGGASVPVVCISSSITFTGVTLVSAVAGGGGAGLAGQAGQAAGGNGGIPDPNGGCSGGRGGAGGAGGAGGGGAGGVSAGILYKGGAPTVDMATTSMFVQGTAGSKGDGGVPGTNDGIDGPSGLQVLAQ
jgi:hypothetical protein